MKWVVVFLMLLSLQVKASYTNCPEHIFEIPEYKRAWSVLKNMKPRFEIGACQVEIHICAPSSAAAASDDIVGDLWLKNANGVEQYMTFYFPKDKKGDVDAGENWLRYHYQDAHYDDVNGDKEKISLSIDLWNDNSTIAKILLSTYSSTEHDRFLGILPMSIQSACFR